MSRALRTIFRSRKIGAPIILALAMLCLRLVWGWYTQRQVQAQLQAIQARGEPVDAAEILHPPVPDEQNAVKAYGKARGAIVQDSPRETNLGYLGHLPASARWLELAAASEKANVRAFELVRATRRLQRVQFADSYPEDANLNILNGFRALANMVSDGAVYSHIRGMDAEAVERLLDVLHISRTIQADDFAVTHMVGIGIDALACHSAQVIAPGLRAEPDKIRSLIDQLLDEQPLRSSLKRTLANERVRQIQWYRQSSQEHWLLAPLTDRDLTRQLPNFQNVLDAACSADFQQATEILQRCQWDRPPQAQPGWMASRQPLVRYSRWFYYGIDFSSYIDRHFRVLAERRLTAIDLACQLYRIDHKEFPKSLDELVPKYLSAIPSDPFFSDGRPIGYAVKTHAAPRIGPRPVLYVDPGGIDLGLQPQPQYDWYGTSGAAPSVRQYRDISRFTPTPALQKTINSDPNISNAPGDNPQKEDNPPEPEPQ